MEKELENVSSVVIIDVICEPALIIQTLLMLLNQNDPALSGMWLLRKIVVSV